MTYLKVARVPRSTKVPFVTAGYKTEYHPIRDIETGQEPYSTDSAQALRVPGGLDRLTLVSVMNDEDGEIEPRRGL